VRRSVFWRSPTLALLWSRSRGRIRKEFPGVESLCQSDPALVEKPRRMMSEFIVTSLPPLRRTTSHEAEQRQRAAFE